MLAAAEPGGADVTANPAVGLGLAIGAGAMSGRDKLTLIVPPAFGPFGLWIEQLIAESTGKSGKGVVPIAGEPLADPACYGTDRLFVRLRVRGAGDGEADDAAARALKTFAPVVEIDLDEPAALGAEFVRWEIATAIAGAILGIDPFDQPNVQQAKDATQTLLGEYKTTAKLPIGTPDVTTPDKVALTLTSAARTTLQGAADALLTTIANGDYFALLAYLGPDTRLEQELQALRRAVRDRTRAATMFGYGPRYLHSTGQLHKGGPNDGLFVQVVDETGNELSIPGRDFGFARLIRSQAAGDLAALEERGRRVIRIRLEDL
jgi:transaldolase / glucose-6-phosphate isomerase